MAGTRAARFTPLLCAAALLCAAHPAQAQKWPERQIKIIAASAPGGGFDLTARVFADRLGTALGTSFIVENRTGAGTRRGTEAAAQAAPDGYTFLVGALPNIVHNTGFYKTLRYDPQKDFRVLGIPVMFPYTLVVPTSSPFQSLKDLVDYAKANPEKLNYGGGKGSGQQVATAIVAHIAGIKLTAVPYRGAQAVHQDLLAGRIDLYFDNSSTARPLVEGGRLRAIVVSAKQRLPYHPDVPTVRETGIADFDQESWFGLFALSATPEPIVERMRAEMKKIAENPEVRSFWEKSGGVPLNMTIAEQEKMIAQDLVTWKKRIIDAGEQQE